MAKIKTRYVCRECGFETASWLGRCSSCQAWNSFEEVGVDSPASATHEKFALPELSTTDRNRLVVLGKAQDSQGGVYPSGIQEIDRVLGGGLVESSVTLVAGEPGIGKSTLVLQMAGSLARKQLVLYISAEESFKQVASRAKRLKLEGENLILVAENNLFKILSFLKEIQPSVMILDSIQAVFHPGREQSPGSLLQVRDSAALLERFIKESQTSLVLVGHVTKDGAVAGPKTLEHMVDTVLSFEGDRYQHLRMLRALKNRNGSTGEIGLFEMTSKGLEEVKNPSSFFMSEDSGLVPGRTLIALMEGERPLLVEVQALVTQTSFLNPARRFAGVESSKASLLIAVIEKNLNLNLSKSDLFLKVSGGLSVGEPAGDLGITLAIISSFLSQGIPRDVALIGELGLGGEVRPVRSLDARVRECARLGFRSVLVPKQKGRHSSSPPDQIKQIEIKSLSEAYQTLLAPRT